MKLIPLTQGQFAIVDDEDYEHLSTFTWYVLKRKNSFYAIAYVGTVKGKVIKRLMHRLVLKVSDSKVFVDHKNHNCLDNQKSNLRQCTRSQNAANRTSVANSSSKYLGVFFIKSNGRWKASISHKNKKYHIGNYGTEIEAALAYNEKALELHGDFANPNIIKVA